MLAAAFGVAFLRRWDALAVILVGLSESGAGSSAFRFWDRLGGGFSLRSWNYQSRLPREEGERRPSFTYPGLCADCAG